MGPKRKGFLQDKLSGIADALGQIAGSVGEVVSSAGELLVDADLRRKGAQYIVQEASRGINEAQRGLEASADALGRSLQQGAKARFGAGARQLQSVLRNIERQIQDFQRQQQQHDLESELEHHHKLPVDIQIGDQVFEDMPQEMRSRFWYVLLERPDLAQQLLMNSSLSRCSTPVRAEHVAGHSSSSAAPNSSEPTSSSNQQGSPQAGSERQPAEQPASSHQEAGAATTTAHGDPALGTPFAAFSRSPEAPEASTGFEAEQATSSQQQSSSNEQPSTSVAAAAAAGAEPSRSLCVAAADAQPVAESKEVSPGSSAATNRPATGGDDDDNNAAGAGNGDGAASADDDVGTGRHTSSSPQQGGTSPPSVEQAAAVELPRAPSPWLSGHNVTSVEPPVTAAAAHGADTAAEGHSPDGAPMAPSPWQQTSPGVLLGQSVPPSAEVAAAAAADTAPADLAAPVCGDATAAAEQEHPVCDAAAAAAAASAARAGEGAATADGPAVPAALPAADGELGWEIVSDKDVPSAKAEANSDHMEALDTVRTLVQSLSEEVCLGGQRAARQAVFQAMLEVPWVPGEGIPDSPTDGTDYAALLEAGCGSVEEVILRDVPRTFPEHPLFNTPAGQQRLLRVLKAYAAADPEVGYCQGMAFAAGVLLMYLPEEPAFRLFRRIMSPGGPNLRRYYLPGLDYLKLELSCFELLLSSHQPQLHQHLLDAGLPALLYAAQWLMTTFSCPFPIHVAARVLDVLLQSDSDAMLPRFGLAVMDALSSRLLELDDFEELITFLKVKPLSWPLHAHRKVFEAALQSTATEEELQAATAAAREEFARCGRIASFSNRHLTRQATSGGTTRHELAPGPMGPQPLAAAEAAAAAAAYAAVDSGGTADAEALSGPAAAAADGNGEDNSSQQQQANQQQQRQLSGRPSSIHDAVLVGPAGSGIVVDELDALEDLITDLDLLMPGGGGASESENGECLEPGRRGSSHSSS